MVPTATAVSWPTPAAVDLGFSPHERDLWMQPHEICNPAHWRALLHQREFKLVLPYVPEPDPDRTTSRFIAKVGMEVLACKTVSVPSSNDEIVNHPQLDELRRYVRHGQPNVAWPVHMRRLYPPDEVFPADAKSGSYQVLHEFDLLYTEDKEMFAAIAIFGFEYVINLGGPEIDGYVRWLREHADKSPLYVPKSVQAR
jgi:hypothetical protein